MIPEIQVIRAADLSPRLRSEIIALCSEAYEEDFAPYLDLLPGAVHVIAVLQGQPVSHVAWVEREVRAGTTPRPLKAAYVEGVATLPRNRSRGFASLLLRALPPLLRTFDIAALSPSDARFYLRLGWELWRGPLAYRREGMVIPTPEEQIMILRLPKTPTDLDLEEPLETDWRPGEVW